VVLFAFFLSMIQSATAQQAWDAGDFIAFFFLFVLTIAGICAGIGFYARKYGEYQEI